MYVFYFNEFCFLVLARRLETFKYSWTSSIRFAIIASWILLNKNPFTSNMEHNCHIAIFSGINRNPLTFAFKTNRLINDEILILNHASLNGCLLQKINAMLGCNNRLQRLQKIIRFKLTGNLSHRWITKATKKLIVTEKNTTASNRFVNEGDY